MKKLFGGLKMSWLTVVLFAMAAGVYTGLINQVPFLADTSFRDIAVSYEVWMLFAVIIAVNCQKPLEAACKVFVFFAISQPLCFAVEIPWIGKVQALSYLNLWVKQILLTFPGGFVAYYAKKDNWFGAVTASAGAGFEAVFLTAYASRLMADFPHHLLTVLLCIFVIYCFVFLLIQKKACRIFAIIVVLAVIGIFGYMTCSVFYTASAQLPEGYNSYTLAVNDGSTIDIDSAHQVFTYSYKPMLAGNNTITFTNSQGDAIIYQVVKAENMVNLVRQ